MDLAKIRKKSLQTSGEPDGVLPIPSAPEPEQMKSLSETVPAAAAPLELDVFSHVPYTMPDAPIVTALPTMSAILPERDVAAMTPLEAILAGRTAAGCDDESIIADETATEVVTESRLEFLCFRVSDEIYGINIMDIKEIIKPREVTEVPRAPAFVSGVLSLRGTIIPIIDMRARLGLAREDSTGKERIIVIRNCTSLTGLLVDEVIQVVQIPKDAVEAAPTVLDGIDREFISGIGRSDGRLIILLNLENIADIHLY